MYVKVPRNKDGNALRPTQKPGVFRQLNLLSGMQVRFHWRNTCRLCMAQSVSFCYHLNEELKLGVLRSQFKYR